MRVTTPGAAASDGRASGGYRNLRDRWQSPGVLLPCGTPGGIIVAPAARGQASSSVMISRHNARHSEQIATRAAAASPVTWWRRLPQKLHLTGAPYLLWSPTGVIAESGVAVGSPDAITRSARSMHS